MRIVANFFLWLIGVAIPVVIAACYGMPYRYSKTGKVVDAETQAGIEGLRVSCEIDGIDAGSMLSYQGGQFEVWYDQPCDNLVVTDGDGVENGGLYQEQTVPFCESCETILIEMNKAP